MTMNHELGIDRRGLMRLGLGGGLAALGGAEALAQRRTIDVLMAPSPARPELLRLFLDRTGVTVRPAPYVSPTDTMNRLLSGNAPFSLMNTLSDLVRPSLSEAVDRGLLLPFDTAKLPNAANLAPLFREDVLVKGGQSYSMPIYWGYNAVLYNRRFIPDSEPLTNSWGLVLDDKYAGRVAIRDDAHESIHMVALYMGHRQPLEMDRSDLREVVAFLKTKKRNFRALWSRFAEAVQLMASNEVHAMFGWLLMRTTLQAQGMDVVGNHPKEGLLWWIHSAFIPRSSPNPEDAHRWLDFMLSGEYGRRLTELAGVLSTSQAAVDGLTTEQQQRQGYDTLTRGGPMVRLGSPKRMDLWLEAWAEFKAA